MAGTVSFNDISSGPHAYSVSDRSVRGVNYEIYCTVILERSAERNRRDLTPVIRMHHVGSTHHTTQFTNS